VSRKIIRKRLCGGIIKKEEEVRNEAKNSDLEV